MKFLGELSKAGTLLNGWRIAAEKKETLRIRIISIICGVTNYLFFCTPLVINTKPRELFYAKGFNLWSVWLRFSTLAGTLNLTN